MKLPYGIANFEKLRTEGYFYVDKTRYIELLESMPECYVILLRPRRFGKTLFANMLEWYYDRMRADRFEALFKGTYIYEHPTPKHHAHMLLTFNFSGINTETVENANRGFWVETHSGASRFVGKYNEHFTEREREDILKCDKPNDLLNVLFQKLREKGLENRLYVIIDEYDHFANNLLAQGKDLFKELVETDGYVRPFYETLKKGAESVVDRIFITGVLPILPDSLTSGFNIGMNVSADERFNEMFGFTENEITPLLEYLGDGADPDEIRTWYDGYRFSPDAEQTVYNSDMILYYGLKYNRKTKRAAHMIDPNVVSDYRKIRAILSIGERETEENALSRIVGENSVSIHEIARLFVLTRETEFLFDQDMIVSLLFYMGYLTISGKKGISIELAMPNLVLKSLYLEYMRQILARRGEFRVRDREKTRMLQELVDGKIDRLVELTEKMLKSLSNRDYQNFDEKYVKVVMLSLLSDVNVYIPRSEYEIDAGYVDLYLQPAFEPEHSASYFIELKYAKARASQKVLDKKEREGIQQMDGYLGGDAAKAARNLQAYVLVFCKDRCARKILRPTDGGSV